MPSSPCLPHHQKHHGHVVAAREKPEGAMTRRERFPHQSDGGLQMTIPSAQDHPTIPTPPVITVFVSFLILTNRNQASRHHTSFPPDRPKQDKPRNYGDYRYHLPFPRTDERDSQAQSSCHMPVGVTYLVFLLQHGKPAAIEVTSRFDRQSWHPAPKIVQPEIA